MVNRRNAIRAAIGGMVAAVCPWWWKRPDIVAITPEGVEPPDDFEINGDPVYNDSHFAKFCWECENLTRSAVCSHCGFDGGVQPDGSFLVPPRFNEHLFDMVS